MSIKDLRILNRVGVAEIPEWIDFSFQLGRYISNQGTRQKKTTKVLISLPTEQFFSLFITMGIVDKAFSLNKQLRSIRKTILNLEKGNRIIYQDEQSSRKASVISVEPSPVFEGEFILKIKDGKFERGIPEKQWFERVILIDEEYEEIKRTRKVSKKQKVGLDAPILNQLYTSNKLNKVAFYPDDSFYLIGNTTKITESITEDIFFYNGVKGSISDFLYLDNSNSYTNGKLISSQQKKVDIELKSDVPAIFSDVNSYLKQGGLFEKNPKIIVASRTDNENRNYELKEALKTDFLLGDYEIITNEVIEYLETNESSVPWGVEILAWR